MSEVPDFSGVAEEYAAVRPLYPPELFAWLASSVERHDDAWDTATGSGQAAMGLAEHFSRVVATDRSEGQIRHARPHPRIEYRVAPSEDPGLPDRSMDLVATAAAIHWFDRDRFDRELRRILRPGGVAAAWTYHVARAEGPMGEILWSFYEDVVAPHFAAPARLVDDGYEAIHLPGEPLPPPPFKTSIHWTADQIFRFIRTWSGTQEYIKAEKRDPVELIEKEILELFDHEGATRELVFPLYVKASRL